MEENTNIKTKTILTEDDSFRQERIVIPPPNTFLNIDCMELMKEMPDNFIDLAIVDPPYGIDKKLCHAGNGKNSWSKFSEQMRTKRWDVSPPEAGYFTELFRVSKNQIIWGGNYFGLPKHRCFVVWDKLTFPPTMSRVEQAWTSFDTPARLYVVNSNNPNRIHPTEKPVELYKKLLIEYAKQGDLILDTHVGSGSSLIACIEGGFNYYGCEIDKEYYEAAQKRIARAFRQFDLNFNDEAAV